MTPTSTSTTPAAPGSHAEAAPIPTDPVQAFIETRLRRNEMPRQIADAVKAHFGLEIGRDEVIPYWKGEIALPTQTGPRPDKESVQIPADQVPEPCFTRRADVETPHPMFKVTDACATQTGHRQDAESLQDAGDAPTTQTGRRPDAESPQGAGDAPTTQTERRPDETTPDEKTRSVLTDEMKAFIVRGLARYETPTRVAASMKARFGIAIDRRQVHAYDPAGSRPPAQRWIDLHAATRAKFLDAASEIGVAQKVVRLRMLDRFANWADENNYPERAAAFLVQAAKECGGFYERFRRPSAAPPAAVERPAP